jgi:uncharacterized protein YqeY
MPLQETIAADLIAAMKARDALRTGVLRMAKAALKNREIDKMAALDEAEAVRVLHGLVKQREDAAAQYRAARRPELAEKEEAEVSVLQGYLPRGASEADIEAAVAKAVAETGAASPKDLGKVMKAALAVLQAAGQSVDGRMVNEAARRRLAGGEGPQGP